jgi:hypothetical protein
LWFGKTRSAHLDEPVVRQNGVGVHERELLAFGTSTASHNAVAFLKTIPARWLIIGAIIAGTSPLHIAAQPQRPTKVVRATTVNRTADGHPDLQGVWANSTITRLERPKDLGDNEFFTKRRLQHLKRTSSCIPEPPSASLKIGPPANSMNATFRQARRSCLIAGRR